MPRPLTTDTDAIAEKLLGLSRRIASNPSHENPAERDAVAAQVRTLANRILAWKDLKAAKK